MTTVALTTARMVVFNRLMGNARSNLPARSANVVCTAINLAAAILEKRELSADIQRMEKFGIDDCGAYRDRAKQKVHAAFNAFADAVGKAVQA